MRTWDFDAPFRTAVRLSALAITLAAAAWCSGTFGKVVAIGGHASDIALDEGRGVLYIANYTANRVEVMRTSDQSIPTSLNIIAPGALALSRDGQYLVVTSYANSGAGQSSNIATIITLDSNVRRTVAFSTPPLGVAFGADGLALILTTTEFILLDPASGGTLSLGTIAAVAAQTLPVAAPDFPPQILTASLGVSGDGETIFGLTNTVQFQYDVESQGLDVFGYTATPPLGPRLVSVNQDGSEYITGWSVTRGNLNFEFSAVNGALNIGSHAIDSKNNLIYAQIPPPGAAPAGPTTSTQCFPNGICITLTIPPPAGTPPPQLSQPPNLMVADADTLTVRSRLLLAENLAGRSILNAAGTVMYSISDSGVTVFNLGALNQLPQLAATREDVLFQGSFCDRKLITQQINIVDPNGLHTDFRLSLSDPALAQSVTFSATSGTTPATITITVDPAALQFVNGTSAGYVLISSNTAVNMQSTDGRVCPQPASSGTWAAGCFRLLINNPDPDQRGVLVDVPGALVDVLADPARNQFYVIRQDKNQVLVFDGTSYAQTNVLRTSNTPMQLAFTADNKYLMVGYNDAQFISVFDLDAMKEVAPIPMPFGHYPRSIAAAGGAILAASRVAGPVNQISRIDFASRTATPFPTLGPFKNSINSDTVLVSAPQGNLIMAAQPDGNLLLYDAGADTFTVARKDFDSLSGAYAATNVGQFLIDNKLLNNSLVQVFEFDQGQGGSSGFAFLTPSKILRTTGPVVSGSVAASASLNSPGVIERVDLTQPLSPLASRTIELPLFPTGSNSASGGGGQVPATSAFIRTLAPLSNGNAFISLTQSGFTALPVNFDATTAAPVITGVVTASDPTQIFIANPNSPLTPGGFFSIVGLNLIPAGGGKFCATLNGVFISLTLVSQTGATGQLPPNAPPSGVLIIYSPGGVSNPFTITTQPIAPSILQAPNPDGTPLTVPAVYRLSSKLPVTLVNPVHKGDQLVIFATGLGPTNPITIPTVTLDGATCPVTFVGLVPGTLGIYEIEVNVPQGIQQGLNIPLTVTSGGLSSTVGVRVVQ